MRVVLAFTLALFALGANSARAVGAPNPVALFQAERSAMGGNARERIGEIIEQGSIDGQGQRSSYASSIDPRTGASKTIVRTATGTTAQGFDAGVPWSRTGSTVDIFNGPVNRKAERAQTYIARNGWWHPTTDPATFTYRGRMHSGEHDDDIVRVVPLGGDQLDVHLDTVSHLIDAIVETDDANQVTVTTYGDYRTAGATVYPFLTTSNQGDAAYAQTSVVLRLRLLPRLRAADLRRPESRNAGSLAGRASTRVPLAFDLPQGGHIILTGRVDGSRPLHFIFDTGGSNSLTPETAHELGLRGAGNVPVGDAGGTQVSSQVATIRRLAIGGATLRNQTFAIVALPKSIADVSPAYRIDGLVGSEVLDAFVVSIDYVHHVMKLYDPASFHYRGIGTPVPFVSDGQPLIAAALNGHRGLFLVDTGNPSASEVPGRFLRAHGMTSAIAHGIPMMTGALKSLFPTTLVRIRSLRIGTTTLHGIPFAVSETASGPLAARSYGGLLGEQVLSRFTVTLDYARSIIYFEPNADRARAMSGNRTGATVTVPAPGRLLIAQIISGGPAAQAGLRTGDVITSVDGKPAYRSTFATASETQSMTLRVARGRERLTRSVPLRELLRY